MDKFCQEDLFQLQQQVTAPKVYKLSEVENRLVKVAFDVVRFVEDDGLDKLWRVENRDDGDYIVAMYEEAEAPQVKTASANPWLAEVDAQNKNIYFFYDQNPVAKRSLASLYVEARDSHYAADLMTRKLGTDTGFRQYFISSLTTEEQKELSKLVK